MEGVARRRRRCLFVECHIGALVFLIMKDLDLCAEKLPGMLWGCACSDSIDFDGIAVGTSCEDTHASGSFTELERTGGAELPWGTNFFLYFLRPSHRRPRKAEPGPFFSVAGLCGVETG